MTPATLLIFQVPLGISFLPLGVGSNLILGQRALFRNHPPPGSPVLRTPFRLRLPLSSPPPLRVQQTLVGALLVGLVGDVGQVHSAEGWTVVQHNVAHAETQDICL